MIRLALLLILLAGCATPAPAPAPVFVIVSAPVSVRVRTRIPDGMAMVGAGVVIGPRRIATLRHVVPEGSTVIRVSTDWWGAWARVDEVRDTGGREPVVILLTQEDIPCPAARTRRSRAGDSGSPIVANGYVIGLHYGVLRDGSPIGVQVVPE